MNGYNFTERVRKVLAMAREEAARLGHQYVGTEHELLGLIREGEGIAATILQNLGVDLDKLKTTIEERVRTPSRKDTDFSHTDLPYSSRAKKTLEFAMIEAREQNHSYVGTEHLLLGLVREGGGIGAQSLNEAGVTVENARAQMLSILDEAERQAGPQHRQPKKRATPKDSMNAFAQAQLSERIRDVLRDAEDVATECKAAELMPIHVAIALVRSREGFANAVLDRLKVDRAQIIRSLMEDATNDSATELQPRLKFSEYMVAFMRQVESENRWRHSPPSTLNLLLALLDNVKEVALTFQAEGVDAARVRGEARRMSG